MRQTRVLAGLVVMIGVLSAAAILMGASHPTAIDVKIQVTVLDPKGAPVPNAGVVLKQLADIHGKAPKHAFDVELKTDGNGAASMEGFEPGTVLVQVIATGYQTYGKEFKVRQADEAIHVKLQNPKPQVTIYH